MKAGAVELDERKSFKPTAGLNREVHPRFLPKPSCNSGYPRKSTNETLPLFCYSVHLVQG